jgi:hypothetical protein
MTTNCRRCRAAITVCVASLALALAGSAAAQSLGDVAREEVARRQATSPTKVYTNADLGTPEPASAAAAPAAAAQSAVSSAATADADKEKPAGDPKGAAKGESTRKDEKYWRDRMKALREGKTRAESFAEALQSRINALSTDFINRDDPAQRNRISADRQKALDELARVKKEIVDSTKAIEDLQSEARHEGVPPGWLR